MDSNILVERADALTTLTLNRTERANSIDPSTLADLEDAISAAEAEPECRILRLQGRDGIFCTGLDLAASLGLHAAAFAELSARYMAILARVARCRLVVVASVNGRVLAGGVGLAAACDLVIATPASHFCLPESLWGVLPACVLPWLMRRTGFQAAYAMALTASTVDAHEARQLRLVDLVADNPDDGMRRLLVKLLRVAPSTVSRLKDYCQALSGIDVAVERRAVEASASVMADPNVRGNIAEFVTHQRYPWERDSRQRP